MIPFVPEAAPDNVVSSLESYSASLSEWFSNTQMNANPEKCHLLRTVNRPTSIKIGEHIVLNSIAKKCLVFKSIVNSVLARITPYMCSSKRKLLTNAFFKAQFRYCPLVWMCHSRSMNNKINRLHERCHRIIHMSSFANLIAKDGSVAIPTRNLQDLATEMFKVYKNMLAELMHAFFV